MKYESHIHNYTLNNKRINIAKSSFHSLSFSLIHFIAIVIINFRQNSCFLLPWKISYWKEFIDDLNNITCLPFSMAQLHNIIYKDISHLESINCTQFVLSVKTSLFLFVFYCWPLPLSIIIKLFWFVPTNFILTCFLLICIPFICLPQHVIQSIYILSYHVMAVNNISLKKKSITRT